MIFLAPVATSRFSVGSDLASERSHQVDGGVDHDPHYVHEVPIDPADLDAVMVLRGKVAAEGPDRHEEQDREADEDVRAMQARQAVEDRSEGAVVWSEADA